VNLKFNDLYVNIVCVTTEYIGRELLVHIKSKLNGILCI